jgi:RNA polymerase sigma-70 factor (ECF subfamily)
MKLRTTAGLPAADSAERFRTLFETHQRQILGFALRRVDQPSDAADIVSDVFTVVWRRIDQVPLGDEARLWLYGVARRCLSNYHRGSSRRTRLQERLGARLTQLVECDPSREVDAREAVLDALQLLPVVQREVMQLAIWEQLTPAEIAMVLDLPSAVVRKRLFQARSALRLRLTEKGDSSEQSTIVGHEEHETPAHLSIRKAT